MSTLYKAGAQRRADHARAERVAHAELAERDRVAGILAKYPQIGVLMTGEGKRYYLNREYGTLQHADPAALVEFIPEAK